MRELEILKRRYAAVLSYTGAILLISGFLMLTPLLLLPFYPREIVHAPAFGVPAALLGIIGLCLWRAFRYWRARSLSLREGGVIVLITWITVIFFSAIPLSWAAGVSFSRAVFESVSGWTTTGLSVIDVRKAGQMVLMWRSVMQLAGGAGLAIIMMSAIVGRTGIGISSAEGRSDQLVPQVRQSARLVLIIYTAYAVSGIIAYLLAGMSTFDAMNQAFAAISTGGFSTHPQSIGFFDSVPIEAVTLSLMFLGNLSFITAWFLWRGKLSVVFRNGEIRLLAIIVPLSVTLLFLFTARSLYPLLGKSIRVAVFETISAITTTGFSTAVGYVNWNSFGVFLLIILMLIGGGVVSTAGGIKQFRIYLLWKITFWEIRRAFLPKTAVLERPVWNGDRRIFVDDARIRQIMVFIFLYMVIYITGTIILCACGYSLSDSLFEFASAIGTVGLSVGVTSAGMPGPALWAETIAMFLGRLEILVVFISLIEIARDFKRMIQMRFTS